MVYHFLFFIASKQFLKRKGRLQFCLGKHSYDAFRVTCEFMLKIIRTLYRRLQAILADFVGERMSLLLWAEHVVVSLPSIALYANLSSFLHTRSPSFFASLFLVLVDVYLQAHHTKRHWQHTAKNSMINSCVM